MHFQYLVEDSSSAELIGILMDKIADDNPDVTFNCKSFRGIGGFTKRNTVKETKTGKLLNDLATYLRGFNRSLQGIPAAIVVVLDNDDRQGEAFREELENVARQNMILADHVFCIAVEEVEAWLLGDQKALTAAYPAARSQVLREYVQDSICGTWEVLADAIYPGGIARIKKNHLSYMEIGRLKSEWARQIGIHMDLQNNASPSFNYFIQEIKRRIAA